MKGDIGDQPSGPFGLGGDDVDVCGPSIEGAPKGTLELGLGHPLSKEPENRSVTPVETNVGSHTLLSSLYYLRWSLLLESQEFIPAHYLLSMSLVAWQQLLLPSFLTPSVCQTSVLFHHLYQMLPLQLLL